MDVARVLMVQLDHADPPGRLLEWLVAAGAQVQVVDLADGQSLPEQLEQFAAVVVLGGTMSSSDDATHPFLADVRALLRSVVRTETPTLAVCLGAQLLAQANGGRVEPNPEGPELGAQLVAKRTNAATDPLFRTLPIAPDVLQWHWDIVSVLPPGAVQLAGSPVCENEAYRLGRLAWGIQFHIETTPEVVQQWAAGDAHRLTDYDLDRVLERAIAAHDDVEETWRPMVEAFVQIARDPGSVAASTAVPTSTAAPVTDPAAIRAALAAEAAAARGIAPMAPATLPMPTLRRPADG